MRTQHFNIFNTGTESFFTPGTQLASIARVKPDAPAVIYVSPENKESVMTWRELHELSNRIAWYLLGQGIGPGGIQPGGLRGAAQLVRILFPQLFQQVTVNRDADSFF